MKDLPFFTHSLDQVKNIQSLLDNQQLGSKLNQLEHTLSLHITGNDQIETLHLVRSNGFTWANPAIHQTIDLLYPDDVPAFSERLYEDLTIHEVILKNQVLSYSIVGDYLAYSTNPILVEDVIRAASDLSMSLFNNYEVKSFGQGELSIVFNSEKLDGLERVFFQETSDTRGNENTIGLLELSVDMSESKITVNGLTTTNANSSAKGVEADLNERNYLPNELSEINTIGLEELNKSASVLPNFDLEEFLGFHKGSITSIELDAGGQENGRALLAAIDNPLAVQDMLDKLALELVSQETDTLYQEEFMDGSITFLNRNNVISGFYGSKVPQFDQCYYSVYNDVLILGETVDVIKLVLNEYDNENTWGKIVSRRQFLDDLIRQTRLTKIINFQFSVDGLKERLKPKWTAFFENQQALLDVIDLVAVQLSNSGGGVYASTQVTLNPLVRSSEPMGASQSDPRDLSLASNAFADKEISTKPFVVKNHNDGSQEIMFQDVDQNIYLISKEGTVLWKKTLDTPIKGNVSQIDYYNNRRLQYFFLTESALHLIDRNGNYVEDFPKTYKSELPLLNSSVVDYDNSKRYRYLSIDRRGNAFLFNKEGDLLDGWNPRVGVSDLIAMPQHIRVRGKDCFVFVRSNGIIELTNRRGDNYPGFPYRVNKRVNGDVRISLGPDFTRTTISVSTEDGLQLAIDLNGKVKSRSQLFKPSIESRFSLVEDAMGSDHITVRKDLFQTVFFNSSGKELFKTELILDKDDQISFYNFRNESEVYLVNKDGELFIFDNAGKLKFETSIMTSHPIGLVYYQSRGEYELFVNFENQFAVYRFRK